MEYEDYDEECNNDCENCGAEDCDSREPSKPSFVNTEIATILREKLKTIFNLPDDKIEDHITELHLSIQNTISYSMKKQLREVALGIAKNYINTKADSAFEKLLDEALDKEIVTITGDNNKTVAIKKAQTVVLSRIDKFMSECNGYGKRRNNIEEKFDAAVERYLEKHIGDVLEEIKTEAIDKFNKATMKKMMQGMAKAIGEDKRLITLLESGN